jgi:hypothetical protein
MKLQSLKKQITAMPKRSLIILGIAAVLVLGDAGFYFNRSLVTNSQSSAQSEVNKLIAQVGTLIVLPANEQPVVATVSDPELLRGQALFADAQIGDKLLIYNVAHKAILYSPKLNKIIAVAPLSASVPTASQTP